MKARENPFRSERVEGLRFRSQGLSSEGLADRAVELRACAIVGPEGSGKTTLLEGLAGELRGRGYAVRLHRVSAGGESFPRGDPPADGGKAALLLDGLESAGSRARPLLRALKPRWDLLILSAHRPGLLPTLVELRTSPGLLEELVRELVGEEGVASLGPDLPRLFEECRGNIRECLRELYDRVGRTSKGRP